MNHSSLLFRSARLERRGREAAVERLSRACLLAVAVACAIALLGYAVGRPWLVGLGEFPAGIRSAAALSALAAATAALLVPARSARWRRAGTALSAVALAIAMGSIVRRARGHEELLGMEAMASSASVPALLAAVAIELRRRPGMRRASDAAAGGVLVIATGLLVAQLVAHLPLPEVPHEWPRLVPGSLVLLVLAVGILLEGPRGGGVAGLLADGGVAGRTMRVLLPTALLLPATLEVLHARSAHGGVVRPAIGSTLLVTIATIVLGVMIVRTAALLRAYEAATQRTRETSFLSVLSHDLRTPLIAIRNLGQVVHDRWDELADDQKRRTLLTTADQASRLLGLIHESVMVARLEAGELPNHPADVPLHDALERAVAEHRVDVAVDCPPQLVARIDPEHLRLMVTACLEHAGQCSHEPARIVAAACGPDVRLKVEHCAATSQLETPTAVLATPAGDTPLELWTVAELARLSGGDACYERIAPDRARFVVVIPRAAAPAA